MNAVRHPPEPPDDTQDAGPAALLSELPAGTDLGLLRQALTHRSYAYENGGLPTNERLEFLGDAVLGLVVTEELYRRHPELPEGQLAKLRSAVVNSRALAGVAEELDLGRHLFLGRGEEATGGRRKLSILADSVEAVLGAVHLSAGADASALLVHRWFDPLIDSSATLGAGLDWKTSLQELAAALNLGVPDYRVSEEGPDHAKRFQARVVLAGADQGVGSGGSKKEAEQRAAEVAFLVLSSAAAPREVSDLAAGRSSFDEPEQWDPAFGGSGAGTG